ncbi:TetR/AcrR family transcriptional regulator [Microlunatus soli]|uniref:DNA-binding transcriptional regulator YbjK n=1 Tax=Microlunatus soli TaxID=630515 RepID=A0A1H2ACZ3_9ACTN|nr:hypothetical protein [Microlunatus soli]SDT43737.1 DNA-binding transcriptional regulator YbjK [Microlunatus soli]
MTRRETLVQAAVDVVATSGLKGLTHRAVDGRAGLPSGSAANVFRDRDSLIRGVLDELERRSRELWATVPPEHLKSIDDLARVLANWLGRMTTEPDATLTRARLAMTLAYPEQVASGHLGLLTVLERAMADCGVTKITSRSRAVAAFLDGHLLHALTVAPAQKLSARQLLPVLRGLLGNDEGTVG